MTSLYDAAFTAVTAEEEAYNYILAAMRQGIFQPGDRLKAEDIAHRLGMSRMPVREAFRRLATEDLLTMRPNRGASVTRLTEAELREIFEMRSVLEGLAVRSAMEKVTPKVIDNLRDILARMMRCREDGSEWLVHHRHFHEYICSLSERQRLMRQIRSLHTATEPYIRLWFLNVQKPIDESNEHEGIIDSLKTGDADIAERFMRTHIMTTAPQLAELLRR